MGTIYGNEYKDHLTGLFSEETLHCFLRIKQDIRFTLLNFSLWRMKQPWEVPLRQINDVLLWIVREGAFCCSVGGETKILHAGEGFLAREGTSHSMTFAPGNDQGAALVIHLKFGGYLEYTAFDVFRMPFFRLHTPEAFFHSLERAIVMKNIAPETAGKTVSAQLFELMMDWAADGFLVPEKIGLHDVRIRESMNFIHQNLNNNISVADIAGSVGLHEVRFREIFRKQTGMTPLCYLKQARLERVSELLIKTLKPLSEIAVLTGFSTSSYLCSSFRVYSGQSPETYRRMYQQRYRE